MVILMKDFRLAIQTKKITKHINPSIIIEQYMFDKFILSVAGCVKPTEMKSVPKAPRRKMAREKPVIRWRRVMCRRFRSHNR